MKANDVYSAAINRMLQGDTVSIKGVTANTAKRGLQRAYRAVREEAAKYEIEMERKVISIVPSTVDADILQCSLQTDTRAFFTKVQLL